ncbi:MAG TPA: DTW domain-containing protein [Pusillimonas sp.]|uniref:tRNA-uridine aminocarboxypropyltransferase n=1 Tax=Pusillimonas sp. TaxID=3040095 RepID=UPI002C07B342|nr:DTW domain-containing protein [Pusillimonas sp.]HUH86665.1 DTW domain-containing protein [Pusillimonas sp.]
MPQIVKPSRVRCARCLRPESHCLCSHITVVPNRSRVLILQHTDEARHPLNTARLAVLGLKNAELLVGEWFPQLNDLLASAANPILLFPASEHALAPVRVAADGQTTEPPLLVVPDGTWRMARKIIRANPVLGSLPRLTLPLGAASEYRVRKAREPAAVSTIEAVVRALSLLEPQGNFQPLLRPFHVLVQQQIQAMGPEVFHRNHAMRIPGPLPSSDYAQVGQEP